MKNRNLAYKEIFQKSMTFLRANTYNKKANPRLA